MVVGCCQLQFFLTHLCTHFQKPQKMAPTGKTIRARKTTTRRRTRSRTHLKKQMVRPNVIREATPNSPNSNSSSSISSNEFLKGSSKASTDNFDRGGVVVDDDGDDGASTSGCSTPKAQRFRIPEMVTCPPAPKKQRVLISDCSFRRTPIAFFAPPDLELFFYYALRGISV